MFPNSSTRKGRRVLISTENKANIRKHLLEIVIFLAGLLLIGVGLYFGERLRVAAIGIGCSLVVASIVSLLAAIFYARAGKAMEVFGFWGLKDIFRTRQAMNSRCDITFESMNKHLDIIAWGLNSFRNSEKAGKLKDKINSGLRVRILAPDPDSPFTAQQDRDEGKMDGYTADTIQRLKEWAETLNDETQSEQARGSIELRFYNFRPQDFYWRQDSYIYIGPYLYGVDSQQTISFEYESPSRGFDLYSSHFDKVWAAAANEAMTPFGVPQIPS